MSRDIEDQRWKQLCYACRDGKLNHVLAIIEAADNPYEMISNGDETNYTALHWASSNGRIEIVQVLLGIAERSGRTQEFIAIRNYLGQTALSLAKLRNNEPFNTGAVIELLESYNH
jgi:hypothetical protein